MKLENAVFRKTGFIPRDIEINHKDDGSILMKCRIPLELRETSLPAYLRRQARNRPKAQWLFQRLKDQENWRSISFGDALNVVNSLTQSFLNFKLDAGRSLVILCDNSIEHALVSMAAMQASIPVVPLSSGYYLRGKSADSLNERLAVVKAGVLFVNNSVESASALDTIDPKLLVISVEAQRSNHNDILYSDLSNCTVTEDVDRAFALIDPNAPARFMFTSGSTGAPKPTIHTQINMIAAIESNLMTYGQTGEGKMARLDWMPWNHVVGTAVLGATLVSGGTYYIDNGKPIGALFSQTIKNLRDISPTGYFSMPAGYIMLVDALEADDALAHGFFKNLHYMGYGGARLPDDVARRMQKLAVKYTGYKVPFTCGYGSTESGPGGALVYWPTDRVGLIGLPHPGYDLKLVPIDAGRYEVWVKGIGVTPGYFELPELNQQIFDEDGFIDMGDAATFVDPEDPNEGLAFAGRLSEEFKLLTGTFVLGSALRVKVLDALAPLIQDVVVCGEDKSFVGLLAWLNVEVSRSLAKLPNASIEELIMNPIILRHISSQLSNYNKLNPGSSTRIARFQLLKDAPSFDDGEVNDKNTINPRAVQRLRAALVDALYEPTPTGAVTIV